MATQNILREEAHLCDVIDPLGGSHYIERLTDQMEEEILRVMAQVDEAGGMYKAVEAGLVQRMIGESALAWQEKIESGNEKIVGVNCYQDEDEGPLEMPTTRPDPEKMKAHIESFKAFKASRSQTAVDKTIDSLVRAAHDESDNVFSRVIDAAEAGVTHGEIIACLREELGFGHPLIVT